MDRVICKRKKTTDKIGYLRLSNRQGNKTIIKSLGIDPIPFNQFNPRTQRVRTSYHKHEEINNYIEKVLKEVERKGNKLILINDERKSFVEFLDKIISQTTNQGTKLKYINSRNLIVSFNNEVYKDLDLKFSEITPDFVVEYKKWLSQTKNQTTNTITRNVKQFKYFINQSIRWKEYTYDPNPFVSVKNKTIDTDIDILDKEDLKKLMTCELKEVYRNKERFGQIVTDERILKDPRYKHNYSISDVRRFFLFQLFSQGLRVSDLMTLRWNNFQVSVNDNDIKIRIVKRMIKTGEVIKILLNYSTLEYLLPFIPDNLPNSVLHPKKKIILENQGKQIENITSMEKVEREVYKVVIDPRKIKLYDLKLKKEDGFYLISEHIVRKLIESREREIERTFDEKDTIDKIKLLHEGILKDGKLIYLNDLKSYIKSEKQRKIDEINLYHSNEHPLLQNLHEYYYNLIVL